MTQRHKDDLAWEPTVAFGTSRDHIVLPYSELRSAVFEKALPLFSRMIGACLQTILDTVTDTSVLSGQWVSPSLTLLRSIWREHSKCMYHAVCNLLVEVHPLPAYKGARDYSPSAHARRPSKRTCRSTFILVLETRFSKATVKIFRYSPMGVVTYICTSLLPVTYSHNSSKQIRNKLVRNFASPLLPLLPKLLPQNLILNLCPVNQYI